MSSASKPRRLKLTWLLILQAWTMLWVVIGHAPLNQPSELSLVDSLCHKVAQALFDFAYSFHMPLFIMISGYLFNMTRVEKEWNYASTVKDKVVRLGIPYVFFITLAILSKILLPKVADRAVDNSVVGLMMNYIEPFNGALQEMWFIAVIFIYFLMMPFYRYVLKDKVLTIILFVISIGLFFVPTEIVTSIFALDKAVHFFIFFFTGLVISRYNFDNYISSSPVIMILSICFVVSSIFNLKLVVPFTGSLSFWGLAVIVDKTLSNSVFKSFRNYTYQIFLIGIFVQIAVKFLYVKFSISGTYPIWWLICVLLGIYIPVMISKIAYKTNSRFLKLVVGLS